MKHKIVYLIGFMASGKTQLGKKIAKSLGFDWIDLDDYIAQKAGLPIRNIFSFWGEDKFRAIEQECLHEIHPENSTVISCGGGTPCFFDNMGYMLRYGVVVYLDVPVGMLVQRLAANSKNRPMVQNKTELEINEIVNKMMSEREPIYKKASLVFKPSLDEFENIVSEINNYLIIRREYL